MHHLYFKKLGHFPALHNWTHVLKITSLHLITNKKASRFIHQLNIFGKTSFAVSIELHKVTKGGVLRYKQDDRADQFDSGGEAPKVLRLTQGHLLKPDTCCLSKLTASGTSAPKTKSSQLLSCSKNMTGPFPPLPPASNKKGWRRNRQRAQDRVKEMLCFYCVVVHSHVHVNILSGT